MQLLASDVALALLHVSVNGWPATIGDGVRVTITVGSAGGGLTVTAELDVPPNHSTHSCTIPLLHVVAASRKQLD